MGAKGARLRRRSCRRVVFASLKGKVSPNGDEYKESVTCFLLVSPVLHGEEH